MKQRQSQRAPRILARRLLLDISQAQTLDTTEDGRLCRA